MGGGDHLAEVGRPQQTSRRLAIVCRAGRGGEEERESLRRISAGSVLDGDCYLPARPRAEWKPSERKGSRARRDHLPMKKPSEREAGAAAFGEAPTGPKSSKGREERTPTPRAIQAVEELSSGS